MCVGIVVCVCPSDWAHMCTPAVVGLQEHLNTLFILPVHTHTLYCRQSAGAALYLSAVYCVCKAACHCGSKRFYVIRVN